MEFKQIGDFKIQDFKIHNSAKYIFNNIFVVAIRLIEQNRELFE